MMNSRVDIGLAFMDYKPLYHTALVGYEIIIIASLAIFYLKSNARSWNNCLIDHTITSIHDIVLAGYSFNYHRIDLYHTGKICSHFGANASKGKDKEWKWESKQN